jgi:two-component system OmpR family sensor kinase
MSSNRAPERGIDSWSLRRRLIFEQVVLLAMVCVIIVAVTEIALRAFLLGQLDNRLEEASGRVVLDRQGLPGGRPDATGEGGPGDAPGQVAGTINAVFRGSFHDAVQQTRTDKPRQLTTAETASLMRLSVDGQFHTMSVGGLGEFRLKAQKMPDGTVIVTGLPMSEVDDLLLNAGLIMGGVALAGLLAAAGAGALIVRRALDPLQRVAATASRVAELPLDRGEVELAERVPKRYTDPHTEVGRVGLALNRMLGNVQEALSARHESETRVRQFVADASHELRTPLAAVRGYAELIRRRDDDVAPEVAHALGRVESEAARMTTLVEDLLLLARLDSGRPLQYSAVDLSRLVVDAVSDAQVAGSDHVWRLDLPPDPVTVTGDAARLHQVVANLLSNARTHTPPGTTVTVELSRTAARGAATGRTVVLVVTDDGPGIPADLLPEVFERFARGDSSRSRAAGSTGLGLAIVAAVVAAHHGHVTVESRPGRTRFTVRLPGTATAQG